MEEGKTEGKIEERIDGKLDEERVVEGPGASTGLTRTKGRTARTFPMPLVTMSTRCEERRESSITGGKAEFEVFSFLNLRFLS